jgi:hypothetical protein
VAVNWRLPLNKKTTSDTKSKQATSVCRNTLAQKEIMRLTPVSRYENNVAANWCLPLT